MSPRSKHRLARAWAVATGLLALAFVGADWLAREWGRGSFMAPSRGLLWLSIDLGCGVGLIQLAAMWWMPTSLRDYGSEYRKQSWSERLRSRYWWRNLAYSFPLLLLLYGLLGWCWLNEVSVLPAISATNAVLFVALPPWALSAFRDDRNIPVVQVVPRDQRG
jgi:hypothetical protein